MHRSLLVVGAHPDDETFFAAGTIAKCAHEGVPVTLVCATRGQRGATGNLCSIDELPAVREQEVRDAARILGVRETIVLDYEDQQLVNAKPAEIRKILVEIIRRVKAGTVLTFDPNGVNLHSDHVAISRFTSDALAAAADPRWLPESGEAHVTERLLWPSEIFVYQLHATPNPGACPGVDFLIDVGAFWKQKEAALRAHRTQLPGFSKLFFAKPEATQAILSTEAFRLAFGPRPPVLPASDLFA